MGTSFVHGVALTALAVLLWGGKVVDRTGLVSRHAWDDLRGPMVAVAVFALALLVFTGLGGHPSTALALFIMVSVMAWSVRDSRRMRMEIAHGEAVAEAVGVLAATLRAGATTVSALEQAAGDNPQVKAVLKTAARRAASGGRAAETLADSGSPLLVTAAAMWRLSERHGIPLATLMDQLRDRIDARERHRRSTSAALKGPQATAVVLSALPLAGIGMGTAMGANPLGLLTGGGLGGVLLVVGVSLASGGYAICRIMLNRAAS